MASTRPSQGNLSLHLVSDLDGTWIPAPGRLEGLRRLEAFLEGQPGIVLTFATGRGLASALALLAERVGRLPHHLVTDVGTALHHRMPGGSKPGGRPASSSGSPRPAIPRGCGPRRG